MGLLKQAQDWLAAQPGLPDGVPRVTAPDSRVRIPDCAPGFEFSLPFSARDNLLVRCADGDWSLYLQVRYEQTTTALRFVRDLRAGERLDAADVSGGSHEWTGYFLRSTVRAGQTVTPALLDEAVSVYATTQTLAAGTELTREMFRPGTAPASRYPASRRLAAAALQQARTLRALPAGHILTPQDLQHRYPVLVAAVPIARGAMIDSSNTSASFAWGKPPADIIADQAALPRAAATTMLSPGQPIRASVLRALPAIAKGEAVTVSASRNLVTVSIVLTALDDGEIGEQVRLRNDESGELVRAIVIAPGAARIP